MRARLLTFRASETEHDRLQALAAHYGIDASAILRMLVKRDFDALDLVAPKPGGRPKAATKGTPTSSRRSRKKAPL